MEVNETCCIDGCNNTQIYMWCEYCHKFFCEECCHPEGEDSDEESFENCDIHEIYIGTSDTCVDACDKCFSERFVYDENCKYYCASGNGNLLTGSYVRIA